MKEFRKWVTDVTLSAEMRFGSRASLPTTGKKKPRRRRKKRRMSSRKKRLMNG